MTTRLAAGAESRDKGREVRVAKGRSRVAAALAGLAAGCWLLAGCGGSGPALVDSSTTRPVPTATAAATTGARPATSAAPTTGAIPTTTGSAPLTTAETGPAGQALRFRGLTVALRGSWRAGGGGDHVQVTTGQPCRRSVGGVDCPGFLLLGPSQIAVANELAPYDPERPWHPGAGVEGCPQDRDGLAELTPDRPAKRGQAKVGGRAAVYREWRVTCVDATTNKPKTSYLQRVWYLAAARILVVDEWSTAGLAQVLAAARFR
jgi:hypothetical protein